MKKNLDFYGPMCHISIDGTALSMISKSLNWHGWQPMYLPSYSPDLNPIERTWLTMKTR
jgi:transposase